MNEKQDRQHPICQHATDAEKCAAFAERLDDRAQTSLQKLSKTVRWRGNIVQASGSN